MISVTIPVYRNAANIESLLQALHELNQGWKGELEAVFVVDGSPDSCFEELKSRLPYCTFRSQLLSLSRNFGSFAAICAGLSAANGEIFVVMAADLQEPPELLLEFVNRLMNNSCDLVVGKRAGRHDKFISNFLSNLFWSLYRRFVVPELPPGGVDIFGCNEKVREEILKLRESHSSLIALLYWVGFRRSEVEYVRKRRAQGKSAWTFRKRLRYLSDSVFSFTDLPIRVLYWVGLAGLSLSIIWAIAVLLAKVSGAIPVPGYAATVFSVAFFGGLNCLALGIIGAYVWRTFENTKGRPNFIVAEMLNFQGGQSVEEGSRGEQRSVV